jgi:hypothetical protein
MQTHKLGLAVIALAALSAPGSAATLVLPQNRNAFYSGEPIELAVAGLAVGEMASIELLPAAAGSSPVEMTVCGDGSTVTAELPRLSLAPDQYTVRLNGEDAATLRIASGVRQSTMLLSQTSGNAKPPAGGANFAYSMAHEMGLLDAEGQPRLDVRGRRSRGLEAFEEAIAANLPSLVYHYWTGYVTHKPWGTEKSWASPDVSEAMRLFSFHTAQRLRRYGGNILSIGAIDEPGLSWGETPTGGMASGFPNWNEREWYEARGWDFTHDIAGRPDADWLRYVGLRGSIIRESLEQAKRDLKTVWPEVVFASDLYAVSAIMDGTDTLSQQVNDTATTHVFFDWSGGPAAVPALLHLEKAHDPSARVAHAMNGQLEGVRGPQRPLYHLLMNAMLMAGLNSNWWLNTGGMEAEDLEVVNEPAARYGPLLREFSPSKHDVAILWSFTEMAMRQKAVAARESARRTGEPLTLHVPLPTEGEAAQAELETNAYEVGRAYTRPIIDLDQALMRAGYPAHILDERVLGERLQDYRVLFLNGQTFDLPPEAREAVAGFARRGGCVLVDRSTTVEFSGAIVHDVDTSSDTVRARELLWERGARLAASRREASALRTSHRFSEPTRAAAMALKALLRRTPARPVLVSADVDLLADRQVGPSSALYMVLNVHEQYPETSEDQEYPRYNFAPATMTYTLAGVRPGAVVYRIEGLDWSSVSRVSDPHSPQTATFAAGEMKLHLVVDRAPSAVAVQARPRPGEIEVEARLAGPRTPWPVIVTVLGPDGSNLYRVYRAMDRRGSYVERFPIGRNAVASRYRVRVTSPVGDLSAEATVEVARQRPVPRALRGAVRVFDEETIRRFLKTRPDLVIAVGNRAQQAPAERLAAGLAARGLSATVRAEAEVLRKVAYPRVWSPYATVYSPGAGEVEPPSDVTAELQAGMVGDATVVVDAEGNRRPADAWRQPGSEVTVTGEGLVDWLGRDGEECYEPGVKLYVDQQRRVTVLNAIAVRTPTTSDFRTRWARPWTRLESYVGNFQLPPQLPEAYTTDAHLVLLGDSPGGLGVAALQASELLPQTVDDAYPGPGRALIQFVWSPFAVERNVIFVGASDDRGLRHGVETVMALARP